MGNGREGTVVKRANERSQIQLATVATTSGSEFQRPRSAFMASTPRSAVSSIRDANVPIRSAAVYRFKSQGLNSEEKKIGRSLCLPSSPTPMRNKKSLIFQGWGTLSAARQDIGIFFTS